MPSCPQNVSVADAQELILGRAESLPAERRALADAAGFRLAQDIRIDTDFPPFDRARMDGFAIRAADVKHAPVELAIVEELHAGRMPTHELRAGQASRINTGAPLPPGADTIVPIEQTLIDDETRTVTILEAPRVNQHTEKRACIQTAGRKVLRARTRLDPMTLAIAATAGAAEVQVYRAPRVRIIVTGDELVSFDRRPQGAQIRESNGLCLHALTCCEGCSIVGRVQVADQHAELTEAFRAALDADVLLLSGGASMGQLDLVPRIMSEGDIESVFDKVKVKPGRPIRYGRAPTGTHVFALPGNPVSCFVCFWLFVRPLLQRLAGQDACEPAVVSARSTGNVAATQARETYSPGYARSRIGGSVWVDPLAWQGSSDPFPFAQANALIRQEPHARDVRRGEALTILPLELIPAYRSPDDSDSAVKRVTESESGGR
jgi:molybdopterin molybdotransferase